MGESVNRETEETKIDHPHYQGAVFAYCPRCGAGLATRRLRDHEPERLVCDACRFIFFQNPKVAACAIPRVDGKIVLLRRGIEPSYGKWVYPGGFADVGERMEDAARRETREEVNLDVTITGLVGVYSYPGYPVVIIVYKAEGNGERPSVGDETLEVGLFGPDEIPWDDLAFPSTVQALRDYFSRREDG